MNTLIRWGKFNLVGAMGMVMQLSAFTLFHRWWGSHYLYASAAALELTLLHNFTWHVHYTWRDRRDGSTRLHRLIRFHLSSGLISMLGNLALMRLLVRETHLPLLASNCVAILCCSVVNFYVGNAWAFSGAAQGRTLRASRLFPFRGGTAARCRPAPRIQEAYRQLEKGVPNMRVILILIACLAFSATAQAQTSSQTSESANTSSSSQRSAPLPEAPVPTYRANTNANYLLNAGGFCGAGVSNSRAATTPTTGCGVGLTVLPLPIFFEVGVMGPQANRSYLSGYISLDGSIPLARASTRYLPMAIVGYSRLFETGHALDYGLALALPRPGKRPDNSKSLRLELRDYYTFANPTQHNVMLRVGWMVEEND